MTPLALPSNAEREDRTLATLCKAPEWAAQHATWQAAYEMYRLEKGDPWKITPAVFGTDPAEIDKIAEAQRGFYKSRSSGGPIQRIRKTPKLLCCPMCGSQYPGTVDHYLPRKSFPEFSILPCNLIPACPYCNSGVKKEMYKGNTSPERFIHPYFDTLAREPIWDVEIRPPFEAARFRPQVAGTVSSTDRPMVQFHLDHILGEVFQDFVSTQWSQLPLLIHSGADSSQPITELSVAKQLAGNLRDAAITDGVNGWRTAFLRGVAASQDGIRFLAGSAANVGAMGCVA